uniref:DUF19 domain-containing protein n=1 Tax=Strongyloides papillosus TaxID=174720 RepID=A0A0N5C1P5_STREA
MVILSTQTLGKFLYQNYFLVLLVVLYFTAIHNSGGVQAQNAAEAVAPFLSLLSNGGLARMTQIATDLAVQTMNSNREMMNKEGRPESRNIDLSMSPSQMLGQSIINANNGVRESFEKTLQASANNNNNNLFKPLPQLPTPAPLKAPPPPENPLLVKKIKKKPRKDGKSRKIRLVKNNNNEKLNVKKISAQKFIDNSENVSSGNEDKSINTPEARAAKIALLKEIEKEGIKIPDSIKKEVIGFDNIKSSEEEGSSIRSKPIVKDASGGEIDIKPLDLENFVPKRPDAFVGSVENVRQPSAQGGNINPLLRLAETFLGRGGNSNNGNYARGAPTYQDRGGYLGGSRGPIPNIRETVPGANSNFGIPKGAGCLPFIGEFMQAAYGNCVKYADERTFDAWGNEIKNALTGSGINLFKASIETCKMQAERDLCGQIRKAISECDILGTIQVGSQIQRSFDRCEQVTGIIDQNPLKMMQGINNLVNGEVAQGFINNFLG